MRPRHALKSNRAVHEERSRQCWALLHPSPLRCPDGACASHAALAGGTLPPDVFQRFGKTRGGSSRFRCRECRRAFSVGGPTLRQRRPRVNARILRHLVNKAPLSRIAELDEISFPALYGKVEHLHRQCALFAASREARLPGMDLGPMTLATDRQDHLVNWGSRASRRTIQLTAVATADRRAGYLFGLVPNFDPDVDPAAVEAAQEASGDAARPPHMRDSARFWTAGDYAASLARSAAAALRQGAGRRDDVEVSGTARADLEASEAVVEGQQLPARGAQVHAEYLLHGHFQALRRLLGPGARHLVFCLDEDPGLLNACLAAFGQRIRDGSAAVVQVQVDKKLTIDDRRRALAEARKAFEAEKARFPGLDDRAAGEMLIAEAVAAARASSPLPSRRLQGVWLPNPVPDPAEPRKRWRFVTDTDSVTDQAVARMLRRSSLRPIDRTFNMLRRRVAMFERPVASVRRARRSWHIHAPYDPGMVNRTLEIFRVWHNWLWRSPGDGRTAAERLGLAQGEVRIDHVIGFDMREAVERLWYASGT